MAIEPNFVEFSKPFIEAAKNVFETMVFTKLEPQAPSIKKDQKAHGDISAILGLIGEVTRNGLTTNYKAMLIFSFPYQAYYKIAGAMLSETFTSYVPDIQDVGGEIVNMVMGNAKRDLRALGYTSDMALPSMIEGKNHSINYPKGTTIILIPLKTVHGELYMEIGYSETY